MGKLLALSFALLHDTRGGDPRNPALVEFPRGWAKRRTITRSY